jgi:hypothetical protein
MTTAEYIDIFEKVCASEAQRCIAPPRVDWNFTTKYFADADPPNAFMTHVTRDSSCYDLLEQTTFGISSYHSAVQMLPKAREFFSTDYIYLTQGLVGYQGAKGLNCRVQLATCVDTALSACFLKPQVHCWLTFNTAEILDCTLSFEIANSIVKHNLRNEEALEYLLSHPFMGTIEQLGANRKMVYCPAALNDKGSIDSSQN